MEAFVWISWPSAVPSTTSPRPSPGSVSMPTGVGVSSALEDGWMAATSAEKESWLVVRWPP
eukprot:2188210-Pyramimonas_sp.AAC.1